LYKSFETNKLVKLDKIPNISLIADQSAVSLKRLGTVNSTHDPQVHLEVLIKLRY